MAIDVRPAADVDDVTGVLAYEAGEVVGWAAVAPRADATCARSRTVPRLDGRRRGRCGA